MPTGADPGHGSGSRLAGLVVLALAVLTLAFPERVLGHVEGRRPERPASAARVGALATAFVGLALVVGL